MGDEDSELERLLFPRKKKPLRVRKVRWCSDIKRVKPTAIGSILSQSGSTLGLSKVFILSDVLKLRHTNWGSVVTREETECGGNLDMCQAGRTKIARKSPLPCLHSVCSGCVRQELNTLSHYVSFCTFSSRKLSYVRHFSKVQCRLV